MSLRSHRSCYDEGKRAAEVLCYDYQKTYGIDVKVARVFNSYGPGMREDDGRTIPTFISQALSDRPITIYGDGYQTRSFTFIEDTIRDLRTLMNSKETRPVNIGSTEEASIRQVAEMIADLTRLKSTIEHLPTQEEPKKRKPDITRALALGCSPRIDLFSGVKRTLTVR